MVVMGDPLISQCVVNVVVTIPVGDAPAASDKVCKILSNDNQRKFCQYKGFSLFSTRMCMKWNLRKLRCLV